MADDIVTRASRDSAPVDEDNTQAVDDDDEEMPRFQLTRRRILLFGFFVVSSIAFLYFVLPQLAGLDDTWNRIERGDPWWMALAFVFEVLSIGGYVIMFRTVCAPGAARIDWRASYEITMAGIAATRLFAAGGAGGVVLTAWALRRAGMEKRIVACRMVAFLALLYAVYMGAMIVTGIGLRTGLFPGGGSFGVTVIPAIFAAVTIVVFLGIALVPGDFERRLGNWSKGDSWRARWARRLATVPASTASGVRTAIRLVRSGDPSLLGAFAWWGFNVAILWACFHAFGHAPPMAVIVMGFLVGMLGNLLPLPGGVGGVDGGMIGALIAFGVEPGLVVVAVLSYRAFSFWLPTLPGVIAYFQLRHTVADWDEEPRVLARAPTIKSEVKG